MKRILDDPWHCLWAGIAVSAVIALAWLVAVGSDRLGFTSFVIRFLHVATAMVWVGLVFFVNFVQLPAAGEASDAERAFLGKTVVVRVAWWLRHTSTLVVATGVILMILAGYLLPSLVYGSGVYVPRPRLHLLSAGIVGALVMWMLVHMYIWPALRIVLGLSPGDADAKVAARERVKTFARINLVLALPVVFAMIAAAHLF